MKNAAYYAMPLARMALKSSTLFLAIVIWALTMVKPAQASGTVPVTWNLGCVASGNNGSSYQAYTNASIEACFAAGEAYLIGLPNVSEVSCKQEDYIRNENYYRFVNYCIYTYTDHSCPDPGCKSQYSLMVADASHYKSCPPNSYSPNMSVSLATTCTCYPGYVPDSAGTSCVLAVCPTNMTGTYPNCACNTGYVPNPAGAGCVLAQYTIALYGLGGEVMPMKTRYAYALVTKSDGSPKSGVNVDLFHDVIPEVEGQLPVTYAGILTPDSGPTDSDGKFSFVFKAPQAGGTHTITAVCTNCANQAIDKIKVPGCPIRPLTPLPKDDLCAQTLENLSSTAAQKDKACGTLTPEMQAAVGRFRTKLASLTPAIPLVIDSQRRNYAYQAHFRDIWNKMEDLVKLEDDPLKRAACAARRAEVAAEKGCDNADVCTSCYTPSATRRSHCLSGMPTPPTTKGDSHTNGTAIDVNSQTLDPLKAVLNARRPPEDIQQFLDEPEATGLLWGGHFVKKKDVVHFQVPR